jgi:hypothetical protein
MSTRPPADRAAAQQVATSSTATVISTGAVVPSSNVRRRWSAPRGPGAAPSGPWIWNSYAVTHPARTIVPPQPPGWHQVLLAASGAMTVEVPEGTWFVPPGAAVVVTAGEAHRIRTTSATRLRNLYLRGSARGRPG